MSQSMTAMLGLWNIRASTITLDSSDTTISHSFNAVMWTQCACQYYANPRHGVYELGYPKSDLVDSPSLEKHVQVLAAKESANSR